MTTSVSDVVQNPPSASTPLQETGSGISRNGSLKTSCDTPSQRSGAGAAVLPRSSRMLAPVTFVQAASAPSTAASVATVPSALSPAGSMR